MPEPKDVGLCGRNPPDSCRLVWNNRYSNRIGSYPSDLLPTRRTTWHTTANSIFDFSKELVTPGDGFGLPLGGFLTGFGFLPPQTDVFAPQSHYIAIFAQVANRIDSAHVITQEDIESIDAPGLLSGEMRIDVGEHVMEFLAVLDEKGVVDTVAEEDGGLTEEDLAEIGQTGETEQDKVFRKLFELSYPNNRFVNIERNVLGVEYRLDNGGPKAIAALKSAGTGDIHTASYRDGTSRSIIIKSDIEGKTLKAGDVVYMSYIAIKEHYMRQSVIISWTLQALSVPPTCFAFPSTIKVVNYRYYEWQIAPEFSPLLPETVRGWRAVESHNVPVNVTTITGTVSGTAIDQFDVGPSITGSASMVDFIIGLPRGGRSPISTQVGYLPAGARREDTLDFINDRSTMPTYTVDISAPIGSDRFHFNEGAQGNIFAFQSSEWFTRANFKFSVSHAEATSHVFFNVHPKALLKRDGDKFGIERTVAEQVQEDINNSKLTFFPFMDDAIVDVPTNGANEYLDSSNTKFEPIQPVSGYSIANAETKCGVGGATTLLLSGGENDVIGQFGFSSNFISEKFDIDTKIIVERHFTGRQVGRQFVSLTGTASPGRSLSCTGDPSRGYAFAVHTNGSGKLSFNTFKIGPVFDSLRLLHYRPDMDAPPVVQNNDPSPSQFESHIGYSGMIGDRPGFDPGRVMSTSSYATLSSYIYKTTSSPKLKKDIPNLNDDQITEIEITRDGNKLTIPVSNAFHGRTEINYGYKGDPFESMLIFRSGGGIENIVDSVLITKGESRTVKIDHRWIQGDSIELVGDKVSDMKIFSVTVTQLTGERALDFADNVDSSTPADLNRIPEGTLMDSRQFFETDVMTIGEDEKSRLFVFFKDTNGGISCVQSNDFGGTWFFHYGIVEPIGGNETENPFIVNAFESNRGFLFFSLEGKILCKIMYYPSFHFEDAFIIERFQQDILDISGEVPKEKAGLFSEDGKRIRRRVPAHIAAGDLTNPAFLTTVGKQISAEGKGVTEPYEERDIETIVVNNLGTPRTETKRKKVLKNPIVLGSNTAFTNRDVEDIHFSAYRTDSGTLRLFFVGRTANNSSIQCHFSTDDGINWYGNWEYIEHKMNRLRVDSDSKTQFIDQDASGDPPTTVELKNPLQSNQSYPFGLFVHGYRTTVNEDKTTTEAPVEVESPYVFYQPTTQKVYLFYILTGSLFCKIFPDNILKDIEGMDRLKNIIERKTRSQFIDGNLTDPILLGDLHRFIDSDTLTRNDDGLFVFHHLLGQEDGSTPPVHLGLKNFDNTRNISSQRVCAYELPNANVRVFYKLDGFDGLRAASWNGLFWMVEEFLRNPTNIPDRGLIVNTTPVGPGGGPVGPGG